MSNLIHLNKNKLCVIDVETTGLNPMIHEITEICAIPVNAFLEVDKDLPYFHMYVKPTKFNTIEEKALKIQKVSLADIMDRGADAFDVMDEFEKWFEKVSVHGKKITPLGHNYAFDRSFLMRFFSEEVYNDYFYYHYRDTMIAANFMNDRADARGEKCPFAKQSLTYVCSSLDVKNPNKHSALGDCLATLECYRKMVHRGVFV